MMMAAFDPDQLRSEVCSAWLWPPEFFSKAKDDGRQPIEASLADNFH